MTVMKPSDIIPGITNKDINDINHNYSPASRIRMARMLVDIQSSLPFHDFHSIDYM